MPIVEEFDLVDKSDSASSSDKSYLQLHEEAFDAVVIIEIALLVNSIHPYRLGRIISARFFL